MYSSILDIGTLCARKAWMSLSHVKPSPDKVRPAPDKFRQEVEKCITGLFGNIQLRDTPFYYKHASIELIAELLLNPSMDVAVNFLSVDHNDFVDYFETSPFVSFDTLQEKYIGAYMNAISCYKIPSVRVSYLVVYSKLNAQKVIYSTGENPADLNGMISTIAKLVGSASGKEIPAPLEDTSSCKQCDMLEYCSMRKPFRASCKSCKFSNRIKTVHAGVLLTCSKDEQIKTTPKQVVGCSEYIQIGDSHEHKTNILL